MTNRWIGGDSGGATDPTIAANWSAGVPNNGDHVVFDNNATTHCILPTGNFPTDGNNLSEITISNNFSYQLQVSAAATINLSGVLNIDKTACIKSTSVTLTFNFNAAPSTTVYDGGGSSYTYKPFVIFGSNMTSSAFGDTASRSNTTFNFGSNNFTMVDGIYPNITSTGTLYSKSIYSDNARTLHNTYGSVDMLAINGMAVQSDTANIYDYDKEFYFEGAFTGLGNTFNFGHTTARFKATGAGIRLPVSGDTYSGTYGNDTDNTFYTEYNKVVIENASNNYWSLAAGNTLDCNELVINDGGRLYGPQSGTKAATIKSVKRPTVQGDWNFRQLTDGIYESIEGIGNVSVYEGGTGLQTIPIGSILYGNGNGTIELLAIGSVGQVLTVYDSGGGVLKPRWETP